MVGRATNCCWWILVLCTLSVKVLGSFIRVNDDGGYADIVVAFEPQVTQDTGRELLPVLKEFLTVASYHLRDATRSHFYFKTVSVLVPESWTDRQLIDKDATFQIYQQADIRLEESHDLIAENSRQCGEIGDYVRIGFPTLRKWNVNTNNETINQFIRQWARFRFGVFEEGARNNISRYFDRNGNLAPTGCQSPDPYYSSIMCAEKKSSDSICDILPVSSIMDPQNTQATSFCDDDIELPHNDLSPTLHNVLCQEKSTWDVIKSGSDFRNKRDKIKKRKRSFAGPDFQTVQFVQPKMVLVIDPFLCIAQNDSHKVRGTITEAISKFLFLDYPSSDIPLIVIAHQNLTIVQGTDRKDSVNQFRKTCYIQDSADIEADLGKGIERGEELLLSGVMAPIILISTNFTMKYQLERLRKSILNKHPHRSPLHIVTYPSFANLTPETEKILKRLLKMDQVFWTNVPPEQENKNESNIFDLHSRQKLEDIFIGIIHRYSPSFTRPNTLIHRAYHRQNDTPEIFYVANPSTILINVAFSSDSFITHSVVVEDKTEPTEFYQDAQTSQTIVKIERGRHRYYVKSEGEPTALVTSVWLQNEKDSVEIDGFVDYGKPPPNQPNLQPVIFRVKVRKSGHPLNNAFVNAKITDALGRIQHLELYDSGNGDADIIKRDGTYSRHFVDLSSTPSFYNVFFTATDSPNSSIKSYSVSHSVSFFTSMTDSDVNLLPPNRITDFHLLSINTSQQIVRFSWTAPGNVYDHGNASSYRFLCTKDKSALNDDDQYFDLTQRPKPVGQTEVFTWSDEKTWSDILYFCALKATNEYGNWNARSNLVTVFLANSTEQDVNTTTVAGDPTDEEGTMILAYLWVGVGGAIFIITIGYVIGISCKDRSDRQDMNQRSEPNLYEVSPRSAEIKPDLGSTNNLFDDSDEYIRLVHYAQNREPNHSEDTHHEDEPLEANEQQDSKVSLDDYQNSQNDILEFTYGRAQNPSMATFGNRRILDEDDDKCKSVDLDRDRYSAVGRDYFPQELQDFLLKPFGKSAPEMFYEETCRQSPSPPHHYAEPSSIPLKDMLRAKSFDTNDDANIDV